MIVVDLQAAQSLGSGNRGIGRYTRDLVQAMISRHPGAIDLFTYNAALPIDPRLLDIVPADRFVPVHELDGSRIDVFHMTSPFEHVPIDQLLPAAPIGALVATCFDLIPFRFQERYLTTPLARSEYLARVSVLHGCAAVLTDSASAAADCVELLGVPTERVTVIGGGTNECFRPPSDTQAERLATLRESLPALADEFVFVPTGMDWRKNIKGAMEAYAALPGELQDRFQLVIGCKVTHHERRLLGRWADAAGARGDVLITGFVGDDDLVRLYQTADTVCFPSLYEGFGLPVLEARRCGARVICSNVSSLPEVMPLAAATFNPWSTAEVAEVLGRALTDETFRAELAAAPDPGFTYEAAADIAVGVYRQLAAASRQAASRRRPRVAVVTLLPPSPSGVADHSVALLHELAALADVTAFAVDDVAPPGVPTPGFPVRRLELLPHLARGGAFDAVLYAMGNNAMHRPFLELMGEVPGHVLLHEVRLGEVYTAAERHEMAARHYPAETHPLPLYAAAVATKATSCLVHSRHAADLLLADCGVAATNVGPLPPNSRPPTQVAPITPPPPADDGVWIVTAGIADIVKQTHTFAAAADLLLARHPAWHAAIVGLGGERFVGDESRIVATGRAGSADYADWLARTAVRVQLRDRSHGESSGALADSLAHGLPVIATDVGATRELPDDVVVKVPRDITAEGLAEVIEQLVGDPARRAALSAAALRFSATEASMRAEAERILAAIVR